MSASGGGVPFFTRVVAAADATLYEHVAPSEEVEWRAFAVLSAVAAETLSVVDAWSDFLGDPRGQINGGLFIVAASRPVDPAAYLAGLRTAVQALNAAANGFAYRYLFVGDPTGAVGACPCVLPFYTTSPDPTAAGQVVGQVNIAARNMGLVVDASAFLYADVGQNRLRLAANGGARIALASNKYQPKNITTLTSDVMLPLDGTGSGAFQFDLTLVYSAVPQNDDFTLLDVGLKYFTARAGRILSQRYPVFGAPVGGAPVPMAVRFDPLRPLARDRTAFVFIGDGKVCPPMESGLRDGFLHPIRLAPVAGVSALVLQADTVTTGAAGAAQANFYYLSPAGPFGLLAGAGSPPATGVMCGVSPLETILFDPPGSILTFHPDQAAFSPLLADGGDGTSRLTDRYVTSWITATKAGAQADGAAPLYFAQPQGAALFASGSTPIASLLPHQVTPSCALTDASTGAAFPQVGYGAVVIGAHPDSFAPDDIRRLETDALAVERRARLTLHGASPSVDRVGQGPTHLTTPQGFVVGLASDGSAWSRLHLAQTVWSPDPAKTPPAVKVMAFEDVDETLRAAFQTNQQFLVVTKPKAAWSPPGSGLGGTRFSNQLAPEGWPFTIDVGAATDPGDFRNVLIFKFCDGSLDSRVDDHVRWTAASDFNDDPDSVALWLRAYIDQAKELAKGPDALYFQRFVEAVTTEGWRGHLALRVDVNAAALPAALSGLVAGLDQDRFNAHHVGVDISFVDSAGGTLSPDGNSSVFATVYYVDPVYAQNLQAGASPDLPTPASAAGEFAFRVLTLKTLFANAEIVSFASKTQITLNRLFGDATTSLTLDGRPAASTSLVLNGTYENHDGVGTYVFNSSADARFELGANLWRGIEITKASFSTLTTATAGTVLSRFSFAGYLDFAETTDASQGPFDLLSFGGSAAGGDGTGAGLPFAQLFVDMAFDTASPGTPTFTFRIDQITIAPTAAAARPESLYARLPLTLSGLVSGVGDPSSLGFMRVAPLNVPTDGLGPAWYGLVYTLDLGTAGALAAKAGFTARLLVAWGPGSGSGTFRVAVGLALPGMGGGSRALSLQGVLKLTIQDALLSIDPVSKTFVLRLTNILLSLLGVSLPPGTSTALIIFGNPSGARDTVGWYAAVNREKKPDLIEGGR